MVIMIKNVMVDLQEFILFYVILLIMFSVILGVLRVGNYETSKNEDLKHIIETHKNNKNNISEFPGFEYKNINQFITNILIIMRYSLGDFDFGATNHLTPFERKIFWVTWVIIVLMTCIVFLNFIIAEVSESYNKVNVNV